MCQVLGQHWVVMVVVVVRSEARNLTVIQEQPVLPFNSFYISDVKVLVLVLIPFPQTCTEPSTLFWLPLFLFPALHSYIPYQRDASSAQNLWETLHITSLWTLTALKRPP